MINPARATVENLKFIQVRRPLAVEKKLNKLKKLLRNSDNENFKSKQSMNNKDSIDNGYFGNDEYEDSDSPYQTMSSAIEEITTLLQTPEKCLDRGDCESDDSLFVISNKEMTNNRSSSTRIQLQKSTQTWPILFKRVSTGDLQFFKNLPYDNHSDSFHNFMEQSWNSKSYSSMLTMVERLNLNKPMPKYVMTFIDDFNNNDLDVVSL